MVYLICNDKKWFLVNEKEKNRKKKCVSDNKNIIHMFEVSADTRVLVKNKALIEANLYSNIPQDNIRSLFNEKKSK